MDLAKINKVVFKNDLVKERAKYLADECAVPINDQRLWCILRGLPFVLTATVASIAESAGLHRRSKAHEEGRAWDIRTQCWTKQDVQDFCDHFNVKYQAIAAISSETLKPAFVVDESEPSPLDIQNGRGPHLHCQINAKFAVVVNLQKGE